MRVPLTRPPCLAPRVPRTRRLWRGLAATTAAVLTAAALVSSPSAPAQAAVGTYTQHFLDLYNKIHDPANGYFSPQGIPYHSIETLIVEAPDYGHETTSEAYSYWLWLEATYGKVTGDWTKFNNAWATMERYMIPTHADQPTNSYYTPSKPATYAPELDEPSQYPSPLDSGVPVGQDPLANELSSTYSTQDIYGMHWLADVDNKYGLGNTPGGGCETGPTASGTSYINTFQRGPQESVWETVPQTTCDNFTYGGTNGYLDLFVKDQSYAKQWKYTDAPDADARAIQAAYWALTWATEQGNSAAVAPTAAKAAKMGDYLRYSMFDKYFKQIGNCTDPRTCPGATGRGSWHGLLSWYYAWGGSNATSGGWAWRIGDGASHFGYQNPLAAYALSNVAALQPRSPTAVSDWSSSLTRQLEFYRWLQSTEGGIAGGATNSWAGRYAAPPAGTSTFYGMYYDWQPVYHDPPSNQWFGFQAWSMERVAEYYYATGNATAKALLDKWVRWASANTTVNATAGTFQIPATMSWSGQPDTWNSASPGANAGLHVTVVDTSQDVGVAAALVKTLMYYAAKSGDAASQNLAKSLLDVMWLNFQDPKGITSPETRTDYKRFNDPVFVPAGWSGRMPNGDLIQPGATFSSIRSWYKNDPDWPKVQTYLNGGAAPTFRYHRFWAQADIAMAMADYDALFTSPPPPGDTTPPSAPGNLTSTGKTDTSVSLSWTASTDNVGVTAYDVYQGATVVKTITGAPPATSTTVTGLSPSTTYSFTVKARDAAGNTSPASNSVSVTTDASPPVDTTPPSAPGNLTVTGKTDTSVSVSWTASTDNVGVTAYDVYQGTTLAKTITGTPPTTSTTITGLSPSTTYSFTVKARDAAGNTSPASNSVSVTTNASPPPPTGGVKAQYRNYDSAAPSDNQIKPGLSVVNTGTTGLNLSTVTVRYWFTGDAGATTYGTWCDYALLGCGNLTYRVVALATPRPGADRYLEVAYTAGAGTLAAGASTGDAQLRMSKTDWSAFTESNDYSWSGTQTSYGDWTKVTVYINGTLAWGTEP